MAELLEAVTDWVITQSGIRGLLLIGSHARNQPRPDSDIDLVLLCIDPSFFPSDWWLEGIDWSREGAYLRRWADEEYGAVWSRRVWLEPSCEVEFAFAALSWADASPLDQGTRRVLLGGFHVLYDPDRRFEQILSRP